MKKSIIITFVILMATMFGATAQGKMDNFEVKVDGLGCPFCAYGLEKKFKELKGIEDVKIEIETGIFTFAYPSEKKLALATVATQVEKAGYTPISTKIIRTDGTIENSGSGANASSISKENGIKENAQTSSESFFVAGNCSMCEARIVKAATSVNGVSTASWNQDSKQLKINFNGKETSVDAVQKAVAKAGHDTKNHKAPASTYDGLPGCCHYERL